MVLSSAVKILETSQIPPTENSRGDSVFQESITLNYFDLQYLRFPPTERLLFYEIRLPVFVIINSVLPKLRYSLSLTLKHFRPVAGTLVWPSNSIEPFISVKDDDSVSLTIAESNTDLNFFCSDTLRPATEYRPLVPQLRISNNEAKLMALQITIFPNHGVCIGVTYHHAAHDGKALSLFLKAWANICSNGCTPSLPPELTPVHNRALIVDQREIKELLLKSLLKSINSNGYENKSLTLQEIDYVTQVRGYFTMTPATIDRLRELVAKRQGYPCEMSTFVLTCAYLWVCIVKTERLNNKTFFFVCAADLRGKLQFAVPSNYFGNCVFPCIASASGGDLTGEDGLMMAVEAISKAVKGLKVNLAPEDILGLPLTPHLFKKMRVLSLAGSPQLRLYDTDFGWGKPRKVKVVSVSRNGEISLTECHDGGKGVEIGLMMTEQKMKTFSFLFAKGIEAL